MLQHLPTVLSERRADVVTSGMGSLLPLPSRLLILLLLPSSCLVHALVPK